MADIPVELPIVKEPEPGHEAEEAEELTAIGAIAVEVIPREQMTELAHESEEYMRAAAHVDEDIEAGERLGHLEATGDPTVPRIDPPPPSPDRPPAAALRRVQTFGRSMRSLFPTSPAASPQILRARASTTADRLQQLSRDLVTIEATRLELDRVLSSFGGSADECFRQLVATVDPSSDVGRRIAAAFGRAGVSAEFLLRALAAFDDVIRPGGNVDLETAEQRANALLGELTKMHEALSALDLVAVSEYLSAMAGVAIAVGRMLKRLSAGESTDPRSPASRCHDLGRRLRVLEGQPEKAHEAELDRQRSRLETVDRETAMAEKTVEKATDDLDQLADEDEKLTKELATATAERKAAIEAKLKANKARAAFLSERRLSAQGEIAANAGRRRQIAAQIEGIKAELETFRARLQQLPARRPRRGDECTLWTEAVRAARQALSSSGLPKAVQDSLDAQLRALTSRLDRPFVDLALALQASPNSDPESRAVLDVGWVFARIVADLQATVSRLLDPGGPVSVAMAETRRTMQWALGRLAGYIARLVFFRAGFTGPPK